MLTVFLYFPSSYHPSALKCTRLCLRSMPVAQNQKPLPLNLVRNSVHDLVFLKQFLLPPNGHKHLMHCTVLASVWESWKNDIPYDVYVCTLNKPKHTFSLLVQSTVYWVKIQSDVVFTDNLPLELFSAPALFLSAIFLLTLSRIASASGAIA